MNVKPLHVGLLIISVGLALTVATFFVAYSLLAKGYSPSGNSNVMELIVNQTLAIMYLVALLAIMGWLGISLVAKGVDLLKRAEEEREGERGQAKS